MPKLGLLKHCSGLPLREAAKKRKLGGLALCSSSGRHLGMQWTVEDLFYGYAGSLLLNAGFLLLRQARPLFMTVLRLLNSGFSCRGAQVDSSSCGTQS